MYVRHNGMGQLPAPIASAVQGAGSFVDSLPSWAKAAMLVLGVMGLVKRF